MFTDDKFRVLLKIIDISFCLYKYVISFLAYAVFILYVRPKIWREWRTLLKMLGFAILGLMVWIYYPIRSATNPEFGPNDMNTLKGLKMGSIEWVK